MAKQDCLYQFYGNPVFLTNRITTKKTESRAINKEREGLYYEKSLSHGRIGGGESQSSSEQKAEQAMGGGRKAFPA